MTPENVNVYERLARYLDNLPGGFPRTESGVEMRILRRMFTPEDAEMMQHITLLPEAPHVIARRMGIPVEQAAHRLECMNQKGLLFSIRGEDGSMRYLAQFYAIGFWEGQVNRLDPELARDCEEYFQTYGDPDWWRKNPQLRTIPVGESVPHDATILPYEQAETIVRRETRFAVANCICRQEHRLIGHDCGKPLETCLAFGGVAEHYIRVNRGREISLDEALALLRQAEEAGLVLQPTSDRNPPAICMCCGCCCAALAAIKRHPQPARIASSPFVAQHTPETCIGCGTCETRCQMGALVLDDGVAAFDPARCIGCGLCVTTCPSHSLALVRKPEAEQPYLPRSVAETYVRMSVSRGKLGTLVGMAVRAGVDHVLARKG
jgi:formate hydrogenlyase subunit 6/NADH:ubiquinone oxidoreductase subunit I